MIACNSELLDRLPPQNLDAERGVIGSIIVDPRCLDEVATIVGADDFYSDAHRTLFGHLVDMRDAGAAIDIALLVERLRSAGDVEAIGGAAYLAEVMQSVPVAAHAVHYARIVSGQALRRRVIHAATDMLREAYDAQRPVEAVVHDCEKMLQKIHTGDYRGEPVAFDAALVEACKMVDEIAQRTRQAGLMTGVQQFDKDAGGVFPGELTILAARPSVGKTALALQIIQHVAGRGKTVYFASLEMGTTELALRVLCGEAGVPMSKVRSGTLDANDVAQVASAGTNLYGLPIVMHDRAGLTVQDIQRACRQIAAKRELSLIVVDYLQRVTPADRKVQRNLQVGQISGDLKELARELRVPVLCLCQLSRAAEEVIKAGPQKGQMREPRLSDLKESGDIEQDADMVLFLQRLPRTIPTNFYLAKNRQGDQAKFKMDFHGPETRFVPEGTVPVIGGQEAF